MTKIKEATKVAPKTEVKAEVKTEALNTANILVAKVQRYLYKWQTSEAKLTAKEQKQKRQKIRRLLENFYFKICLQQNKEQKQAAIIEFLAFYKANYILNDFTLASLTDSKEPSKVESYKQMLLAVSENLKK